MDEKNYTFRWMVRGKELDLSQRPHIMGILNVTPDSFSDGGHFFNSARAVSRALQMAEQGADIIDVGGESTRPGSEPVPLDEELRRVIPVIEGIRQRSNVLISVDTYKAEVAEQALQAGADIVNDISAARFDEKMAAVVKKYDCPLVIMHMQGTPKTMQEQPFYDDVIQDISDFFVERMNILSKQGISKIILDPGIGFGKRVSDNLKIIQSFHEFKKLGQPLLIGLSRKSFLGRILDREVDQRLAGTLAANLLAIQSGAHIVRVHDVPETLDLIRTFHAVKSGIF